MKMHEVLPGQRQPHRKCINRQVARQQRVAHPYAEHRGGESDTGGGNHARRHQHRQGLEDQRRLLLRLDAIVKIVDRTRQAHGEEPDHQRADEQQLLVGPEIGLVEHTDHQHRKAEPDGVLDQVRRYQEPGLVGEACHDGRSHHEASAVPQRGVPAIPNTRSTRPQLKSRNSRHNRSSVRCRFT